MKKYKYNYFTNICIDCGKKCNRHAERCRQCADKQHSLRMKNRERIKIAKKFLIQEYSKKEKSMTQIAKEIGCSIKTIKNKLKKFNIPIRTISEAMKGKFKGKNNPNYKDGQRMVSECIDCGKIIGHKGRCRTCENKTERRKKLLQKRLQGEKNPFYIDGRSNLYISIRALLEYKNWRTEIFRRDHYTCQECGDNTGNNLNAHHKKQFHILLAEFLKEYDQFSPIEDKETLIRLAMKWKPFWDINNGKTLCEDCHKKEHKRIKKGKK